MKKIILSIVLTIALLLAGHRANGQECSGGLITHKNLALPQSMDSLSDSECSYLFGLGYELENEGPSAEPAGYDTLRLFLEECPLWGKPHIDPEYSIQALEFINGCVSAWVTGGAGRWPDFLAFLKQILYLNPDTGWYCQDAWDMITAEQSDLGMQMAEFKYLIDNNRCPEFTSAFEDEFHYDSINQHKEWLDSIIVKYDTVQYYGVYSWWVDSMVNKDTLANPYSSTVPSLFDVNLQILLGPQYANAVQPESPITSQALLDATLLEKSNAG